MDMFDFHGSVDVYLAKGPGKRRNIQYRRFDTGAQAVRYLIEVVGARNLGGTVVETETSRFNGAEILELYHCSDYPLARQEPSDEDDAAAAGTPTKLALPRR